MSFRHALTVHVVKMMTGEMTCERSLSRFGRNTKFCIAIIKRIIRGTNTQLMSLDNILSGADE